MGARHIEEFGSYLKAESGSRFYVKDEVPYTRNLTCKACIDTRLEDPNKTFSLYSSSTPTKKVASFDAQPLPGCCGVLLLSNFKGEKLKFIITFINIAFKAAKRVGYGQVLLTLRQESAIIAGLTDIYQQTWRNGKTGNMVVTITKDLLQPEKEARRVSNTASE